MGVLLVIAVIGGGFWVLHHYSQNLPDFAGLKDYEPPILSRVYAGDGRLLATFAAEQRIFVPINEIPQRVKDAFLAAEDKDFYTHPGVDVTGIARAVLVNIQNLGASRRPVGASTITQQVAKNMLLSSEVSISRKIREAILAFRIESVLSKDRILEIYLNQIFLGQHSYGVAAAALNYFNKSLDELTLAEAAYLAALPKAPNSYHPVKNAEAAVKRRNWVIGRMAEDGKISREDAKRATQERLEMRGRGNEETVRADYFAEEVRRELVEAYGNTSLLKDGYAVRTSLDPHLQVIADKALREALIEYDQTRTGYRGPVAHLKTMDNWLKQMEDIDMPPGSEDWQMATVLDVKEKEAILGFQNGQRGALPFSSVRWARPEIADKRYGSAPRQVGDVVKAGDIILVEEVAPPAPDKNAKKTKEKEPPKPAMPSYRLMQAPKIQGAFVALDPHTGRVLALVGGFSAHLSSFNRATQAYRQTGSSFKPFVYLAALDNGFTPSSLINDEPAEFYQKGSPPYRPENYDGDYLGPITLRRALEKSRNVVTVRLADKIGMDKVVDYAKKFGIVNDMPPYYAFALGAKETTLLRLTTAYGIIDNGGKKILPSFIDRIQDNQGKTIWKHDRRECPNCSNLTWSDKAIVPDVPDTREQISDPRTVYQIVSLMEGVATRGTAAGLRVLNRTLAGKTGTTNDSKDVWFVGFSPNLVAGVFIGYDDPAPLGAKETGGALAMPVFRTFMEKALEGQPNVPFRIPPGVQLVKVDPYTGKRATGEEMETIYEAFLPGTDPESSQTSILGGSEIRMDGENPNGEMPSPDSQPNGYPYPPPSGMAPPPHTYERPPAADVGTGGIY